MGTFIIVPTHLTSGGTPFNNTDDAFDPWMGWVANSGSYASVLEAMQDIENSNDFTLSADVTTMSAPSSFNDTVRLQANGACIYLDGSATPVGINELAAGFTPTSASVKISQKVSNPIEYQMTNGGNADFYLQQGVGVDGPVNTNEFDYTMPKTMLAIVNDGMGLRVSVSTLTGQSQVYELYGLYIEGTYELQQFQFNIEPPEEPIEAGTIITVTSPDEVDAINFEEVTLVTAEYYNEEGELVVFEIEPEWWIEWSIHFFLYEMPPALFDDLPEWIEFKIYSTQFSGYVTLGKFITIYFLNAPGIYRLVPGKTNDTLYDRHGGIIEVKIPNPFAKTGYIGG